ncbi:MAG TPA: ribosome-associated translation inhibitor RaiA [Spirochaetota bacterium]|nr:ribosome-associated translation inhibitor RaiA [Spirochaetota bacterium]
MHINIQGRHLQVTPSLHNYIKEKIKKIKYYFDHIVHAHVVLEVIKKEQIAEVTVTVERHHFHNKVSTDDMYKSIDQLFDKIDTQVRRYKEYLQDAKLHRDKHKINMRDQKEISSLPKRIYDIVIPSKPMLLEEAAVQLKIDPKKIAIGFFQSEDAATPSFMAKMGNDRYRLIDFDSHWETKELYYSGKDRLTVASVQNIRIITETVEDALNYVKQNNVDYRFFRSVNTGTVMFLVKSAKDKYFLIREQV